MRRRPIYLVEAAVGTRPSYDLGLKLELVASLLRGDMPLTLALTRPQGLLVRAVYCALLGGLLVFAAHVVGAISSQFVVNWVYNAVVLGAGVLCAARGALVAVDRAAWTSIGLGLLAWGIGNVYWTFAVNVLPDPPYPSLADVGYLLLFPPLYLGLGLLMRRQVHGLPKSAWLDGVIGGLGLAALSSAVLLPPIVQAASGSRAAVVTNLAYPLGDLLLLMLAVLAIALQGWRPGRAWLIIGLGLVGLAGADGLYLFRVATNTYAAGTLVDLFWPIAMLLLAAAAWQTPPDPGTHRYEGWAVLVPPMLFTVVALGLSVYDHFAPLNGFAFALAIATLLGAVVRTILTFGQVLRLADSRRLAMTDDLTGLVNRRGFYDAVERRLAATDRRETPQALLLFDLDRFKELNDTLGHHVGDQLLVQLAHRLEVALPPEALVARLGGDEFAVMLDHQDADHEPLAAAREVLRILEAPFALEGLLAHAAASVGVALCPQHGTDRASLLRYADMAMYEAKHQGSGVQLYRPEGDRHTRDQLELVGDLHQALSGEQLVVYFQPKGDLATGAVTGVEALVRWQHPQRGLLFPDAFIGLAERHGLMRRLTLRVLELALAQQVAWQQVGLELPVAVNVSAANLLDVRFPADVAVLLERWQVDAGALQLEITENTVMTDPQRALDVLARLSELGITFALDDYGTGYSSLSQLRHLPVTELKIDKSFVLEMTTSDEDATIVRSTVELAKHLGLHVVAEGVETADHWHQLADFGAHSAQGYYLSRPLPASELTPWLLAPPPPPTAAAGTADCPSRRHKPGASADVATGLESLCRLVPTAQDVGSVVELVDPHRRVPTRRS